MIKLNARPCTKYLSNGDVFGDVSSVIQSKVSCLFTFKPLSVYPTKQIYDDDVLGDISLPLICLSCSNIISRGMVVSRLITLAKYAFFFPNILLQARY
jgi:hypothetical protein